MVCHGGGGIWNMQIDVSNPVMVQKHNSLKLAKINNIGNDNINSLVYTVL